MSASGVRIDQEVAVVVLRDPDGHFLLTHRRDDRAVFPGRWGCGAGGKVEPGERADTAAARELAEETGIVAEPAHCFDLVYEDDSLRSIVHAFEATVERSSVGFDESEWQAITWVHAVELARIANDTDDLCPDTRVVVQRYLDERVHQSSSSTSSPSVS